MEINELLNKYAFHDSLIESIYLNNKNWENRILEIVFKLYLDWNKDLETDLIKVTFNDIEDFNHIEYKELHFQNTVLDIKYNKNNIISIISCSWEINFKLKTNNITINK